jgi:hypothetical protein
MERRTVADPLVIGSVFPTELVPPQMSSIVFLISCNANSPPLW